MGKDFYELCVYTYGACLMALGLWASLFATDWLYDGESYVVWWIVFLTLWPIIGPVVYGVGVLPVALVARRVKD